MIIAVLAFFAIVIAASTSIVILFDPPPDLTYGQAFMLLIISNIPAIILAPWTIYSANTEIREEDYSYNEYTVSIMDNKDIYLDIENEKIYNLNELYDRKFEDGDILVCRKFNGGWYHGVYWWGYSDNYLGELVSVNGKQVKRGQ